MPDINAYYYVLFFVATALAGLAELRYRNSAGIVVIFAAALFAAAVSACWLAISVALAVAWGASRSWPDALLLPVLFQPNAWPIVLTGTGVRHGMVDFGSLLLVGSLALAYPWQALVMSLVSLDLWRSWWSRTGRGRCVPALPGLLAGIGIFLVANLFGVL